MMSYIIIFIGSHFILNDTCEIKNTTFSRAIPRLFSKRNASRLLLFVLCTMMFLSISPHVQPAKQYSSLIYKEFCETG
jgi:hypothetical protein